MNIFKVALAVIDPLLVAFMVSVTIGVFLKRFSGKLALKYGLCILSFLIYLALYVYGISLVPNTVYMYIIMFAPIALLLTVIIVSVIVAPKGEKAKEIEYDENKKFITGYDSMFPNDLDNERNSGDEQINYE
ncbi:MAG: hypothetical protein ACI4RM_06230 [Ruminococcus sp.]